MVLAASVIVARSAISLGLGIVLVAGLSTYTARPAQTKAIPIWLALPAIVGQICIGVGSIGIGAGLAELVGGGITAVAVYVAGSMATLWACSIVVQIAQNFGYKLVGARVQAIRWYNGPAKRLHRGKTHRRV